ncbi:MAG: O-antigen ligase family protein [Candidatus Komeilibacteria bacterium]
MLNNILIILFLLGYTWLIWRQPVRGVYIITLLLPTYLIRFVWLNIPFTLLEMMIGLLFIVWLIKLGLNHQLNLRFSAWLSRLWKNTKSVNKNYNLIPPLLRWPIIAVLATSLIAWLVSPNWLGAAGIWKAYFFEPVLFFILFVYLIRKNSQLKNIINALAILSFVIFIYALIQKTTGWNINNLEWLLPATRRVTTFFGYPNANGLLLAPLVIIFLASLWLPDRLVGKILRAVALIGAWLTMFWANSEGALIGAALGSITVLLLFKNTRFIATVFIGLAIVGLVLHPSTKEAVWQKITLQDFSGQIRQAQWTESLSMLRDNPWRGGGLANYQNALIPYHRSGLTINGQWQPIEIFLYPHNILLNFWTELGLLGLLAIIWLGLAGCVLLLRLFIILPKLPKYKQTDSRPWAIGLTGIAVAIIIHGLVDVPYFKNDLSVLAWLFLGIIVVVYNYSLEKNISN